MLCSRSASFNPILAQFNLLLTPWQGPAILWNRPKIWSKCAPTPLSRWFIISGLIAFPPNTHTHFTMNCVFLMNRNFERLIPGESRSCCNLEPTLSLSSLCRLSTIRCRPALRALPLILPSSWLYTLPSFQLSTRILQNPKGVWKGNSIWTWKLLKSLFRRVAFKNHR